MRYLSVCSGIEAASVAWESLGWTPVGFAEIDAFPCRVLDHHYPDVKNYGDLTKYKEWDIERGSVDVIIGGTPCQSFSVAGLRKGMDDPRGNLALSFVGLVDWLRPKWVIWENVPGVLSSNGGRDFGAFIGALVSIGYSVSWRVLDAQYFGVAQRRRRVFVVAHSSGDWRCPSSVLFERESVCRNPAESRGKRTNTSSNPKESTGSDSGEGDGNHLVAAASGQAKAEILETDMAPTITSVKDRPYIASYRKSTRATSADGYETWVEDDVTNTLNTFDVGDIRSTQTVVQAYETHPADSRVKEMGETCQTVVARFGTGGGNTPIVSHMGVFQASKIRLGHEVTIDDQCPTLTANNKQGDTQPLAVQSVEAIALAENTIGRQPLNGGNGNGFTVNGPMYTLNATGVHGVAHVFKVRGVGHYSGVNGGVPKEGGGGAGYMGQDEIAYTVATSPDQYVAHPEVYAFEPGSIARNAGPSDLSEVCSTLRADMGDNRPAIVSEPPAIVVRRLTPVECERLQGFPDDYTNVRWYKSKAGVFREELGKYGCPEEQNATLEVGSDSARYKALGNSMAVPVIKWLGEQIAKAESIIGDTKDG
jgi:DNA-cytosine methyltransferase